MILHRFTPFPGARPWPRLLALAVVAVCVACGVAAVAFPIVFAATEGRLGLVAALLEQGEFLFAGLRAHGGGVPATGQALATGGLAPLMSLLMHGFGPLLLAHGDTWDDAAGAKFTGTSRVALSVAVKLLLTVVVNSFSTTEKPVMPSWSFSKTARSAKRSSMSIMAGAALATDSLKCSAALLLLPPFFFTFIFLFLNLFQNYSAVRKLNKPQPCAWPPFLELGKLFRNSYPVLPSVSYDLYQLNTHLFSPELPAATAN
jgi:hypothetical protein